MTDWAPLAIAILALLTAALTLATTLVNLRKTSRLAVSVDGRLSQLLALISKSSHAEGVIEGKAQERENPSA